MERLSLRACLLREAEEDDELASIRAMVPAGPDRRSQSTADIVIHQLSVVGIALATDPRDWVPSDLEEAAVWLDSYDPDTGKFAIPEPDVITACRVTEKARREALSSRHLTLDYRARDRVTKRYNELSKLPVAEKMNDDFEWSLAYPTSHFASYRYETYSVLDVKTGKMHAIHVRSDGPFYAWHCGGMPVFQSMF